MKSRQRQRRHQSATSNGPRLLQLASSCVEWKEVHHSPIVSLVEGTSPQLSSVHPRSAGGISLRRERPDETEQTSLLREEFTFKSVCNHNGVAIKQLQLPTEGVLSRKTIKTVLFDRASKLI